MNLQIVLIVGCLFIITEQQDLTNCTNSNGEEGRCISLFMCPHLLTLIGSMEPVALEFVKKSICTLYTVQDVMVCCPLKNASLSEAHNSSDGTIIQSNTMTVVKPQVAINDTTIKNNTSNETKESYKNWVKKKLLPSKKYCGYQHTDDRNYEDQMTAFDEYPWLVSAASSLRDGDPGYLVGDRCNGVLINRRYVLTYSDCAHHALKVKLGQYNTHKNVSCIENPTYRECTEPPIEVRVEEKIRDGYKSNGPYDFALLRLAKKVDFTDFIRPICLPLEEEKRPKDLKTVIFSGWGTTGDMAVIKKRLAYDIVDNQVCYNTDRFLEKHAESNQFTVMCALAQENNTDFGCYGDYGGPFMYSSKKNQWFVEGTIILVHSCDNKTPVIGLKITPKTIDWILASLRP